MLSRLCQEQNLGNDEYLVHLDVITNSWDYIHSMSYEYIWALFPTIVISLIIGPSFVLLYSSGIVDEIPIGFISVIGYQ